MRRRGFSGTLVYGVPISLVRSALRWETRSLTLRNRMATRFSRLLGVFSRLRLALYVAASPHSLSELMPILSAYRRHSRTGRREIYDRSFLNSNRLLLPFPHPSTPRPCLSLAQVHHQRRQLERSTKSRDAVCRRFGGYSQSLGKRQRDQDYRHSRM